MKTKKYLVAFSLFCMMSCNNRTNSNIDTSALAVDSANKQIENSKVKIKPKPKKYPLTSIEFDKDVFDYGTIKQGTKVEHNFNFKNTGTNDLIISDAYSSCGCTIPEYPKEPIKPGESATIKVVFNSAGRSDKQDKTVNLIVNTKEKIKQIKVVGFVKVEKKQKEESK
jgi:hypothetical protein